MTEFHSKPAWRKLSKDFKTLRCHDCGSTKDIQAGHILAAKRFKMSRLWRINLKHQCQPCNLQQGIKLRKDLLTLKLLVIYMIAFIIRWGWTVIVTIIAVAYLYLDCWGGNHCTITHEIQAYIMDIPGWISIAIDWVVEMAEIIGGWVPE